MSRARRDAGSGQRRQKQPPRGIAVFTESQTVPTWMTGARAVLVVALAATIPTIVGIEEGRRLFWTAAIALLPLFFVLGGYHLWRRICPLAVVAQSARLLGRPGRRRVTGWLAEHYVLVQLGLMGVALSLRLVMTNGTPWALAGFLVAVLVLAIATGFLYTGKTWCNFVCPVGLVEKLYTEPARPSGPRDSKCAPCTACKKHCPDIDLEQGYWKEMRSPSRRVAYFAWPGLVFAFYGYYFLVAGNWDHYFGGAWTLDDAQASRWLGPGLYFLEAVPVVIAAPLTLVVGSAASFALFATGERAALALARRRDTGDDPAARVRHRSLAVAGLVGFLLFYFYGGQPTVRLAPSWVGDLFSVVVVVAATSVFWLRWRRSESDFVQERFAEKLLRRWQWGDAPPSTRLQDVYLLHTERTRERKARLQAYKETVREMVADGLVTRNELALLDSLRAQLGVSDKEHRHIVGELGEEERQLFDPAYQGSIELRLQQQQYQRDLERVASRMARAGEPLSADRLDAVRAEHGVDDAEHRAAVTALLAADGPIAALVRDESRAIDALAAAHAATAGADGSASVAFLGFLCRWRGRQRAERALDVVTALGNAAVVGRARAGLWSPDPATRRAASGDVAAAAEAVAAPLLQAIEHLCAPADRRPLGPAQLLPLVDDASPYLRAASVHLASRFDDEASHGAVVAATGDAEPLVREAAYHALGARGRLERALTSRALADPDPGVRRAAVRWLGRAAGQGGALDGDGALAAAASPEARDAYATLDADARLESFTSLETMMFLRRVPLFQDVDPDDLEEISALASERRFAPGEPLCREGEAGEEVFAIVSGEVEASTGVAEARRVLGRSGPGDTIGEMAVLDPAPRAATVIARTATRVLVLEADAFRGLLRSRPAMAERLLAVLVQRLRAMIG